MKDIKVNDILTWEYCEDPEIQFINCEAPRPVRECLPQWVKDLKGDFSQYFVDQDYAHYNLTEEEFHRRYCSFEYTVRHCLGMRGIVKQGYTIPLPVDINTDVDNKFAQGRLHPEMVHGTQWAKRLSNPISDRDMSLYEYGFRILNWPWRARMAKGWRLIILPYLLDWNNNDWVEFSGAVDPNYNLTGNRGEAPTNIGTALKYTQTVDSDNYNYYNLETVIAYRRNYTIKAGTPVFTALPYFDLELYEEQTK